MVFARVRIMVLLASIAACQAASAGPEGGSVVAGNATIGASGNVTTITQRSDKAIINWNSFGISAHEVVRFVQPNQLATALNRVTGVDPSVILGSLQANGRIFLMNPNGILFGKGSQVNVAGLMATTLTMSNDDFLKSNYRMVQDGTRKLSAVINQGDIRAADGGYVVLVAPMVGNQGSIVANLGKVTLAGTTEATLSLEGGLIDVPVKIAASAAKPGDVVLSSEQLSDAVASVVNDGGVKAAGALVRGADGRMRLTGGEGTVINTGRIAADGAAGKTAGRVDLVSTQRTITSPTSRLSANGIGQASSGGIVNVLSQKHTHFGGFIAARGGETGDGGFAEVSAPKVEFKGQVDLAAKDGKVGSFLLDPVDLHIVETCDDVAVCGTPPDLEVDVTDPGSQITVATINGLLASTNLRLEASQDIVFDNNTQQITWAGNTTFELQAGRDIFASSPGSVQDIVATAAGNVVMNAGRDILFGSNGTGGNIDISTQGGNVTLVAGQDVGWRGISTAGGNINITAGRDMNPLSKPACLGGPNGTAANQAILNAGAGTIALTATNGDVYHGQSTAETVSILTPNGQLVDGHLGDDIIAGTFTLDSLFGTGNLVIAAQTPLLDVKADSFDLIARGAGSPIFVANSGPRTGGFAQNASFTTNNGLVGTNGTAQVSVDISGSDATIRGQMPGANLSYRNSGGNVIVGMDDFVYQVPANVGVSSENVLGGVSALSVRLQAAVNLSEAAPADASQSVVAGSSATFIADNGSINLTTVSTPKLVAGAANGSILLIDDQSADLTINDAATGANVQLTAGNLNVLSILATGGNVQLTAPGNIALRSVDVRAGDFSAGAGGTTGITLDPGAGPSVKASNLVTLQAVNGAVVSAGPAGALNVQAPNVQIDAQSIGTVATPVRLDASSLVAHATTGDIVMSEVDSLTLTDVTANGAASATITFNAGADLTVTSVVATGASASVQLTAGQDILDGDAGVPAVDTDVQANSVTLNAGRDVGKSGAASGIDLDAAQVSGTAANDFFAGDRDDVNAVNVVATAGRVALTAENDLSVTFVQAGGAVSLTATRDILDADNLLPAADLDVVAGTTLGLSAGRDIGKSAAAAELDLGAGSVTAVATTGDAFLGAQTDLTVTLVQAAGTARLRAGRDILDGDDLAPAADTDVVAATMDLGAVRDIGKSGVDQELDLGAGNVSAVTGTGGTGDLFLGVALDFPVALLQAPGTVGISAGRDILDADGGTDLDVVGATIRLTAARNIGTSAAGGELDVNNGNLTATAGTGDLFVGSTSDLTVSLAQAGASVKLTAGQDILDGDAQAPSADVDVVAGTTMDLQAGRDIGQAAADQELDIGAGDVLAQAGTGSAFLGAQTDLRVVSVQAAVAARLRAVRDVLDADGLAATADTDVQATTIDIAAGRSIGAAGVGELDLGTGAVTAVAGTGDVFAGVAVDLAVALVQAGGNVALTAGRDILDADGGTDLDVAGTAIALTAGRNIGTGAAGGELDLSAGVLTATAVGDLFAGSQTDLTVALAQAGGQLKLTAVQDILDGDAQAPAADTDVVAGTTITLSAGRDIGKAAVDQQLDVGAGNLTAVAGTGGVFGGAAVDLTISLVQAGGAVSLTAGQDILDGDGGLPAADTDVVAGSSIALTAGRDIGKAGQGLDFGAGNVTAVAAGGITGGAQQDLTLSLAQAGGAVSLTAGRDILDGDGGLPAADIDVVAGTTVALDAARDIGNAAAAQELDLGAGNLSAVAGGNLFAGAQNDLTLSLAQAVGNVVLSAGRDVLDGDGGAPAADADVVAAGTVAITAGRDIGKTGAELDFGAGNLTLVAAAGITGGAQQDLTVSRAQAGGDVELSAVRDILDGDAGAPAADVDVVAGGRITLTAGQDIGQTGAELDLGAGNLTATAGRDATIGAQQDLTVSLVQAARAVALSAVRDILDGDDGVAPGDLDVVAPAASLTAGGDIGKADPGKEIDLDVDTFTGAAAQGDVNLSAAGDLTLTQLVALNNANVRAAQDLVLIDVFVSGAAGTANLTAGRDILDGDLKTPAEDRDVEAATVRLTAVRDIGKAGGGQNIDVRSANLITSGAGVFVDDLAVAGAGGNGGGGGAGGGAANGGGATLGVIPPGGATVNDSLVSSTSGQTIERNAKVVIQPINAGPRQFEFTAVVVDFDEELGGQLLSESTLTDDLATQLSAWKNAGEKVFLFSSVSEERARRMVGFEIDPNAIDSVLQLSPAEKADDARYAELVQKAGGGVGGKVLFVTSDPARASKAKAAGMKVALVEREKLASR